MGDPALRDPALAAGGRDGLESPASVERDWTGAVDEAATARLRRRDRQETSEAACGRLVSISICIDAPSMHTP